MTWQLSVSKLSLRGDLVFAHVWCALFYVHMLQCLFCLDGGRRRIVSNMYFQWIYLPLYPVLIAALGYGDLPLLIVSAIPCLFHSYNVISKDCFRVEHEFEKKKLCGVHSANGSHSDSGPQRVVKVFCSNLLMINRNKDILNEVAEFDADIVLFQEYSGTWDVAFGLSALGARYPHCVKKVRNDSFGTAVFSKLPFVESEVFYLEGIPFTRVIVDLCAANTQPQTESGMEEKRVDTGSGMQRKCVFYNIHPLPPRLDYTPVYNRQMQQLIESVKRDRAQWPQRGVVFCGDMNASQHNRWTKQMRRVQTMECCHRLCGRGYAHTFPNGVFPVPPIRLDHAFISSDVVQCLSITEGRGQGSDHRPLLFEIRAVF